MEEERRLVERESEGFFRGERGARTVGLWCCAGASNRWSNVCEMLSVFGRERFWRESKAVYSAAGFCGSGWVDGWAGLDIMVARHQISRNSGSCGRHKTVPPFECVDMHTLVTREHEIRQVSMLGLFARASRGIRRMLARKRRYTCVYFIQPSALGVPPHLLTAGVCARYARAVVIVPGRSFPIFVTSASSGAPLVRTLRLSERRTRWRFFGR